MLTERRIRKKAKRKGDRTKSARARETVRNQEKRGGRNQENQVSNGL